MVSRSKRPDRVATFVFPTREQSQLQVHGRGEAITIYRTRKNRKQERSRRSTASTWSSSPIARQVKRRQGRRQHAPQQLHDPSRSASARRRPQSRPVPILWQAKAPHPKTADISVSQRNPLRTCISPCWTAWTSSQSVRDSTVVGGSCRSGGRRLAPLFPIL